MKVALNSYHAFDVVHSPGVMAGGMELQMLLLARLLGERGIDVEFFVGDSGQDDLVHENGLVFRRLFSRDRRNPFRKLQFFLRAVSRSSVDIIVDRGASRSTFWLFAVARLLGKKFVFAAASDVNCDRTARDPALPRAWERWLYHYALSRADQVVLQKRSQAELLKKSFGRNGVVIRSLLSFTPQPEEGRGPGGEIVWIGNLHPYKQPELFLELAKQLPGVPCIMVGGSRDDSLTRKVVASAASIPNVTYRGFVPQEEIPAILRSASVLVNTTVVDGKYEEGFPNTFLQAWAFGVPVVSLISDPDNLIVSEGLGKCSLLFDRLVADVRAYIDSPASRRDVARRCREVVAREFDRRVSIDRYIDVFETVSKCDR